MKTKCRMLPLIGLSLLLQTTGYAAVVTTTLLNLKGESLGTITFEDSVDGLIIKPNLKGLPAGLHGFHLHAHNSCEHDAMDAGGHYDPLNTQSHQGPEGKGHLGDLPVLKVQIDGVAVDNSLAPRLKTSDLYGRAVIVHEGGDNYTDNPPLGGGGARIACGLFPAQSPD